MTDADVTRLMATLMEYEWVAFPEEEPDNFGGYFCPACRANGWDATKQQPKPFLDPAAHSCCPLVSLANLHCTSGAA